MEMHPPRLVAARPPCPGCHRRRLLPMNGGGGGGNGVGPVRELIMINRGDKIRDIDYEPKSNQVGFILHSIARLRVSYFRHVNIFQSH